jgi:hypothetical protein
MENHKDNATIILVIQNRNLLKIEILCFLFSIPLLISSLNRPLKTSGSSSFPLLSYLGRNFCFILSTHDSNGLLMISSACLLTEFILVSDSWWYKILDLPIDILPHHCQSSFMITSFLLLLSILLHPCHSPYQDCSIPDHLRYTSSQVS